MTNAAQDLWRHAAERPDEVALRVGGKTWTYLELRNDVADVATMLTERGVERGDRVLVVLPTSAEFVLVYYGILSLGATAVTVNPLCTSPELEYYLTDAHCMLAIGLDGSAQPLVEAADRVATARWLIQSGTLGRVGYPDLEPGVAQVDDRDPAAILYTSGTTGRPKGAVLTHRNLIESSRAVAGVQENGPDDRMGTALPLFHVFGQVCVMGSIFHVGGSLSLLERFTAMDMLELAHEHALTAMAGVPTMWNEMLHAPFPLETKALTPLRKCLTGGAPLPGPVNAAFEKRFGAHILDGYGLTETTGAATGRSVHHPFKEGSVGRAVPGTSIAILNADRVPVPVGEVGEVAIDGPGVMREYLDKPDATEAVRAGRWFLTGDLGRMDEEGDLWIVGRLKDLIIRGGYNVYPTEIEEVLYSHPAVLECAVMGIPDERLGEEVAAVLVLGEGRTIDASEMRAWLSERLAAYKLPRVYQIVPNLPRGTTGKILKREIDVTALAAEGTRTTRSRVGTPS